MLMLPYVHLIREPENNGKQEEINLNRDQL